MDKAQPEETNKRKQHEQRDDFSVMDKNTLTKLARFNENGLVSPGKREGVWLCESQTDTAKTVQNWPGILQAKREWYVCVELLRNNGTQWTDQETDTNREYAGRKKKSRRSHQ